MARDTSAISSLLDAQKRHTVLLVEIDTDIRYTNWDESITATIESESRTFQPNAIKAKNIHQDGVHGLDDATIEIQNVDNVIGGLAVGTPGIRGRRVQIWEGWYNSETHAYVSDVKLFDGRADGVTFTQGVAIISLEAHDSPWTQLVPSSPFYGSCPYKFKGSLCQYAGGDTSCLRTRVDCTAKGNSENFGGFPYLPDPTKKYFFSGGGDRLPVREA